MTPGKKIIILRKQKGFSQELLAEKSGISLRTIQRLEQDESVPRPHTLKTLADSLDVDVAELNSPIPQQPDQANDQAITLTRLINSSCFLVLVLPIFHVIIPTVLWFRHRNNPLVSSAGKRIISFQVLWLSGCFFAFLLSPLVYYQLTGARMVGKTSPVLITYVAMLLLNMAAVMQAAIRLQRGRLTIYTFVPILF